MRYLIILLYLLGSLAASSQKKSFASVEKPPTEKPVEDFLCGLSYEIDAEVDYFRWKIYLLENLTLDSLAEGSIPAGIYKLTAQFVIDIAGRINYVKVLNDPGYGLGSKVSQVLCANKILWKPAERNGRKIKNYRTQSITFIVGEEADCKRKLPVEFML